MTFWRVTESISLRRIWLTRVQYRIELFKIILGAICHTFVFSFRKGLCYYHMYMTDLKHRIHRMFLSTQSRQISKQSMLYCHPICLPLGSYHVSNTLSIIRGLESISLISRCWSMSLSWGSTFGWLCTRKRNAVEISGTLWWLSIFCFQEWCLVYMLHLRLGYVARLPILRKANVIANSPEKIIQLAIYQPWRFSIRFFP